ncbi:hypothetical protein [Streptomyces sp. bgisy100]|uniref:hypothetical protein n=1 Tax=Streptomyces sp. bgisy100 TaxID=3413783 RepID=UPI003D730FB1
MNRRFPPAAAALAAAGALLLTACGGGDTKAEEHERNTASSDGAKTSAPRPKEPSGPAGGPEISLPKDVRYRFDWPETGDADKDAVLRDGEGFIKATDMAIAEQDPLHKAYRFYSEGKMSASTQSFVKQYADHKQRTTGFYRFYDAKATLLKSGTASLTYCEDQSRAFRKSIKTNKVYKTPVTKISYVLYNTRLRQGDNGIWLTTGMTSQRGAAACQP